MSNEVTVNARQAYATDVSRLATNALTDILGSEEGQRAAARVALAFRSAAAANPTLFECSRESVANCVAMSAMTGLMPGGPSPAVYLVPKRVSGSMTLNWWPTHRGLLRLARTAGYDVRARAVMTTDEFEYEEGETVTIKFKPNLDAPFSEANMRGVLVQVYRISDGRRVGVEYVNKAALDKRRAKSSQSTSGPWGEWSETMYYKTALKFIFARGMVHIADSTFEAALQADAETEAPEASGTVVVQPAESSPRAIAQRDRFDESVGLREEVPAERTDDAPSGGK